MKKQYKAPQADTLKMCPLTPLAVEQSVSGEWGPGGGEAGAKDTSLDIIDDEESAEENTPDAWDFSLESIIKKENLRKEKL